MTGSLLFLNQSFTQGNHMTLSELIKELKEISEGLQTDPEVKLALQTTDPLEAQIRFVGPINPEASDLEYFVPARRNSSGALEPACVYLGISKIWSQNDNYF